MKSYSKLSSKDKTLHNIKGAVNYNLFTISNSVQNLLSNNYDVDLHSDINQCLDRCINELDLVFINHSNLSHENKTENTTGKDA